MESQSDAAYFQRLLVGFCYSATACLLFPVYGMLQERIITKPYGGGGGGEFYTYTFQLTFFDRAIGAVFALVMGLLYGEKMRPCAPLWKYSMVSLTRGTMSWMQYEALKYTSYPMLMLGKSFKMMPVMVWGFAISRKRYSLLEWVFTCGVTTGVVLFVATDKIGGSDHGGSWWGLLFILGILVTESFALSWQDALFMEYGMSSFNQLMWVNLFSAVISFVALCSTGLVPSFAFWGRHPGVVPHLVYVSIGVAIGQFAVFQIVKCFGALVSSTVLNVRQLVAIIASYVLYRHPISGGQIGGLVLTFGFIFWKVGHEYMMKKQAERAKLAEALGGDVSKKV